ncbi:hypothetical protein A4H97_27305 [Niastella yeongjuensis]|uniref:Uncharacterized protein n=1 Tax=Niastella yeongjuensis TaxID=354355 RepID=A0A1V9EYU6_9BACT|nr:hypothetical protein A4H97_27305 [Niastella yeongjuensis]SEP39214.1 hypothetical protein SAMN05660816_05692 [Niastella yeongjuensis]
MCKPLCACFIACFCILFSPTLRAQGDVIKLQSCEGNPYQHAVDSIKKACTEQGYVLLREASIQMESEYEMPVVLPMTGGTIYQFFFIGDPTSKLYEVRMYDFSERQVVYKRNQWGDVDGNIISYTYTPQASEYHMIKPVQVNKKKKNLCGYVMLMKKPEPTARK